MQIADMLTKIVAKNTNVSFHFGEVTVHNSGATPKTVDLTLSGTSTELTGIRYMDSYTPTVADIVLVLVNDKDLIVLGHLEG
jgi:hypothetical protein